MNVPGLDDHLDDYGYAGTRPPEYPRVGRMAKLTRVEIETVSGDWAVIAEFGGPDQDSTSRRAVEWVEMLLEGFRVDSRPRVQLVDGDGNWMGAWSPRLRSNAGG